MGALPMLCTHMKGAAALHLQLQSTSPPRERSATRAAGSAQVQKQRCLAHLLRWRAWLGARQTCSVLRLVLGLLALPWWAA